MMKFNLYGSQFQLRPFEVPVKDLQHFFEELRVERREGAACLVNPLNHAIRRYASAVKARKVLEIYEYLMLSHPWGGTITVKDGAIGAVVPAYAIKFNAMYAYPPERDPWHVGIIPDFENVDRVEMEPIEWDGSKFDAFQTTPPFSDYPQGKILELAEEIYAVLLGPFAGDTPITLEDFVRHFKHLSYDELKRYRDMSREDDRLDEFESDEEYDLRTELRKKEYELWKKLQRGGHEPAKGEPTEEDLQALAMGTDPITRLLLADKTSLPASVIQRLASDENPRVRELIASRVDLPAAVVGALAKDPAPRVRDALARREDFLSEESNRTFRKEVRDRLDARAEHLEDFQAKVCPYCFRLPPPGVTHCPVCGENLLARKKDLPEDVLLVLAKDEDWRVQIEIAKKPGLPENVLLVLAKDESKSIRAIVAGKKHDLPEDVLRVLAKDEDRSIRLEIAERSDLSVGVLRVLAEDEDDYVRSRIAGKDNLPEALIREFAKDNSWWVRTNIARQKHLPVDLLRVLAKDEDLSTRCYIAEREDAPEDLLLELAKDEDFQVRVEVARKKNLPRTVLRVLAKDEDHRIREEIRKRR